MPQNATFVNPDRLLFSYPIIKFSSVMEYLHIRAPAGPVLNQLKRKFLISNRNAFDIIGTR